MRCAIIGAGIAGIAAARKLQELDWQPVLFDKGKRPGGRLATRRLSSPEGDEATLDSGAQFITVRDAGFAAQLREWQKSGLVREWHQGLVPSEEHPRFCGVTGMNDVARAWAAGLTIHTGVQVEKLEAVGRGWRVQGEDFDAAILTAPVPQSLQLIGKAEHPVLSRIAYDRCLAVLAIPVKPVTILGPASWRAFDEGPLSFVADNRRKGISTAPAVTIHASGAYSLEHWDDADATRHLLLEAGVTAHATYFHRWKYSKAKVLHPDRCYREPTGPPLVFAGDAFTEPRVGPRVEGAVLSGWAAAHAITGK